MKIFRIDGEEVVLCDPCREALELEQGIKPGTGRQCPPDELIGWVCDGPRYFGTIESECEGEPSLKWKNVMKYGHLNQTR